MHAVLQIIGRYCSAIEALNPNWKVCTHKCVVHTINIWNLLTVAPGWNCFNFGLCEKLQLGINKNLVGCGSVGVSSDETHTLPSCTTNTVQRLYCISHWNPSSPPTGVHTYLHHDILFVNLHSLCTRLWPSFIFLSFGCHLTQTSIRAVIAQIIQCYKISYIKRLHLVFQGKPAK